MYKTNKGPIQKSFPYYVSFMTTTKTLACIYFSCGIHFHPDVVVILLAFLEVPVSNIAH